MRGITRVMFVLLAALALACGGSGGGGDPTQKSGEAVAASFQPDEPDPGPGTSALALETSSGDTLGLVVSVTGVDDVNAASLDVTFDPSAVELAGWSAGNLLESAGQSPFYLVSQPEPGRVVVGVSLSGYGAGVDVGPAQTLIRLVFRALGPGSSELDFENMALLDSQSTPQEIPGIGWYGGAITAN